MTPRGYFWPKNNIMDLTDLTFRRGEIEIDMSPLQLKAIRNTITKIHGGYDEHGNSLIAFRAVNRKGKVLRTVNLQEAEKFVGRRAFQWERP